MFDAIVTGNLGPDLALGILLAIGELTAMTQE